MQREPTEVRFAYGGDALRIGARMHSADLWDAFGAGGDHFVALKASYWIPLR